MKKVNGKYIRLTEDELKHLIAEEIQKLLEYKKPRKDLVNAAKNNIKELIKHWSIIRFYVENTTIKTTNINHWLGEVSSFIINISDVHLKDKMEKFETRRAAIAEGFEKAGVLNNPSLCERYLIQKLIKERIDYTKFPKAIEKISNDCFNSLPALIDIIARNDIYEIGEYLSNLEKV